MRSFSVNLLFYFENTRVAKTLSKAVEPDNKMVSRDILIKTNQKCSNLKVNINVAHKLETLHATVDDLISCLQVAYLTLILLADYE
jgi:hypothetical protein